MSFALFLFLFLFSSSLFLFSRVSSQNGAVVVNPDNILFETFDNTLDQASESDGLVLTGAQFLGIAGGSMFYASDDLYLRIYLIGGFTGYSANGRYMYTNQLFTSRYPPLTGGRSIDPFLYGPQRYGGGYSPKSYLGKMGSSGVLFPSFAPNAPLQVSGAASPPYAVQCGGHIGGYNVFNRRLYHGVVLPSCFYSSLNDMKQWELVKFLLPALPLPQTDFTYLIARFDHASVIQISNSPIALRRVAGTITLSGVPFLTMIGGVNGSSMVNNDVVRVIPYFGDAIGEVSLITDSAPWPKRAGHQVVLFGPKKIMIISGGFTGVSDIAPRTGVAEFRPIALNDVWFSPDQGLTWYISTNSAAWAPRFYHNMLATDAAIYVLNGIGTNGFSYPQGFSDLWRSLDFGSTWTSVAVSRTGVGGTAMEIGQYLVQACIVQNRIVLFGGISVTTGGVIPYSSITRTEIDNRSPITAEPASVTFGTANRQAQTDNSLDLPGYAIALLVLGILMFILLVSVIVVMVFNYRVEKKAGTSKYTRWNTKVSKPAGEGNPVENHLDYNNAVNTAKPLGLGYNSNASGGGTNKLDTQSVANRHTSAASTSVNPLSRNGFVNADRGSVIELHANPAVAGSFDENASLQFGNVYLTNNAPAQSQPGHNYGGSYSAAPNQGMGMMGTTGSGLGSTGGMGTISSVPHQQHGSTYGSGSQFYPSNTNAYYSNNQQQQQQQSPYGTQQRPSNYY